MNRLPATGERGREDGEGGMESIHKPVLLNEVVRLLAVSPGGLYVDGNLGLGGHAAAILDKIGPRGRVIGFDWDRQALEIAAKRLAAYGDRVWFVNRNFVELEEVLQELGIEAIDGLLLDLGVSSLQLDTEGRGFSFLRNEPLDMRMDVRSPQTAADIVNTLPEGELADLFYYYGEERQARRIARRVVEARRLSPITTTGRLAALVEEAVPRRFHPKKIHVATRVFQALRIMVNRELENLETILEKGPARLKPGGRMAVISFHSLEDRLVKQAIAQNPLLVPLTKRPVVPSGEEVSRNPRSRSARLRVAERREACG